MHSISNLSRRGVRALIHAAIGTAVGSALVLAAAPVSADGVIQFAEPRLTITEGNTGFVTVVRSGGTTLFNIAVHPLTGEIYVVDAAENKVVVFDGSTGTLARMWGMEGSGLSEFMESRVCLRSR